MLKDIHPILLASESRYAEAPDDSNVRTTFTDTRRQIEEWLSHLPKSLANFENTNSLNAFHRVLGFEPIQAEKNGMARILFSIEHNLAAKLGPIPSNASQLIYPIRIPTNPESYKNSVLTWTSFLNSQLKKNIPFMLTFPSRLPWCDLIIGEPLKEEFRCIKLPLQSIPLTPKNTAIELDEQFSARIDHALGSIEEKGNEFLPPLMKLDKRSLTKLRKRPPQKQTDTLDVPQKAVQDETKHPETKGRLKRVLILLALAVLVGLVTILDVRLPISSDRPKTKIVGSGQIDRGTSTVDDLSAWTSLCRDFGNWFAPFYSGLSEDPPTLWGEDPDLKNIHEILTPALLEKTSIDPIQIVEARTNNYLYLADNTQNIDFAESRIAQVAAADKVVQSVKKIIVNKRAEIKEYVDRVYQNIIH